MKKLTLGVFTTREKAEEAIAAVQRDLSIGSDDISYVYKNVDNEVKEIDVDTIDTETAEEAAATGAASGAVTGGAIGALAGLATVAGVIPVIGPIFAAGPLLAALGLSGVVGTTAAAAVTGAAAGGLIGALANFGVSESQAKEYEDRVFAGDILVSVHAENASDVEETLNDHGAISVESYTPAI